MALTFSDKPVPFPAGLSHFSTIVATFEGKRNADYLLVTEKKRIFAHKNYNTE